MTNKRGMQEVRQSLNDALSRIEFFDCCAARRDAEQILKRHPELQKEYTPLIIDYRLHLN